MRVAKCGTSGGYQKHIKEGEPACEPCRAAHAAYKRGLLARRVQAGSVPAHVHGTTNGYSNWGCRCEPCRAAWAADHGKANHGRAERLAADPSLAPHGSAWTYNNWGCRCQPCTRANTAKRMAHRARQREAS